MAVGVLWWRLVLLALPGAVGGLLAGAGAVDALAAGVVGLGGTVALYSTGRHPERVNRLALLASPGLDVPSSPDWRPLEPPVVGELMGKLMDKDAAERTLRKSFAHRERVTPELVQENWAPLSRRDNRRALWLQQRRFDYSRTEQRLAQVRAPTLVLWGDADRFDRPWQANEPGRRIPGATVRILPGCGHSVQEDCPGPANQALSSFLTGRS